MGTGTDGTIRVRSVSINFTHSSWVLFRRILGHGPFGGEGCLAAHSGGSCQASISFDDGETWKVLHSFQGGCPRGARLGSNMADKNQTFSFLIPEDTRAGNALFSW